MADDDDRGPAPDPWDEIVAEGLGDFGDETLNLEEAAGEAAPPVEPQPGADEIDAGSDTTAAAAEAVRGDAEEASIEDWLSGDDAEPGAGSPVLSVFAPDENPGGLSGVDIGTGTSGMAEPAEPESEQDEAAGVAFSATEAAGEQDADDWGGIEPAPVADAAAGDDAEGTFTVTSAEAAAAPAVIASTAPRARKPAAKSGGIGPMVGIVSGGLLAIPVTLAILLFGLGQDPLGLARLVPSQAAFLLPQKVRPADPQPVAAVAAAPVQPAVVDDGAAVTESVTPESTVSEPAVPEPGQPVIDAVANGPAEPEPAMPEPVEPLADAAHVATETDRAEPPMAVDEAAGSDHAPEPAVTADVPAVDPAMPVAVEPETEPAMEPAPMPALMPEPMPEPDPLLDAVAVAAPAVDAPVADPPADPPPAPQPPPLDVAALDAAVDEAAALGAALGAVDDRENRAYTLLRTRWYRSLARVAEELVALDHAATLTGRPLDAAPESVELLHAAIGGREALAAELAALAPDWLSYAKRGSDGVVVPVTFDSARKVGPYWTARATLTDAAGRPRTVTLVSRTEPAAVSGERLVVTGVALDDGVIWAADVRAAAADHAAAPGF